MRFLIVIVQAQHRARIVLQEADEAEVRDEPDHTRLRIGPIPGRPEIDAHIGLIRTLG